MEIILFNPLCKARSALASCPGIHPVGFWMSRGRWPQSLRAQHVLAFNHSHSQVFIYINGIFCIFIFSPCFLFCHWTPLRLGSVFFTPSPLQELFNIARILMFPSRIVSAISAYPSISDALIPFPKQLHGIFLGSFHYFVLYWGGQNWTQ